MTDQGSAAASAAAAAEEAPTQLQFPADAPSFWKRNTFLVSSKEVIFVRPCYVDLFAMCQKAWTGMQGVFLKGTPGVGKSYYLDYAMDRLLHANAKVLLLSGPEKRAWLCCGYDKPIEECALDVALADKWAEKADYVLYDPHENPGESEKLPLKIFCGKQFLIAMSPDPKNCSKIVKDVEEAETVFMGPTTIEESEKMRECCYSTRVSAELLKYRFDQMGGVPRYLFKSPGNLPRIGLQDVAVSAFVERQAFALNDAVQNPLRIDAGSVASQFKSLWSLYHVVPDQYYTSYTIQFASENATSLLRRRLLDKGVQELWQLFERTDERQGTLRGIRFEAYAHKRIAVDGINLTAKKLNANGISEATKIRVVIPSALPVVELRDNDTQKLQAQVADAATRGGGYLLPRLPNYPVLDSAFVKQDSTAIILQMKAGRSKPLSSNHVSTVHAALGNVFIVVVPGENIVSRKLPSGPDGLEQYVLILKEIPRL